jgi:hypothetical protein
MALMAIRFSTRVHARAFLGSNKRRRLRGTRDYEAATSFGAGPRTFYDAGVKGALCDEQTRARLHDIGESYAWEPA